MSDGYRMAGALVLLALGGCQFTPPPAWYEAPHTYRCTAPQMEQVQREATWCSEETSFSGQYCYGAAIMRNCTLLDVPVVEEP